MEMSSEVEKIKETSERIIAELTASGGNKRVIACGMAIFAIGCARECDGEIHNLIEMMGKAAQEIPQSILLSFMMEKSRAKPD